MSVQAITWALDYAAGSVTEKVLLLVLANYANEFGVSWPSQKTLADQTALGERTVRRVLADMEGRGVIRRIVRRRGNGSRQSDMILLAAFEGRKPAPPGMLDDGPDGAETDPSDQPANGDNRPMRPLDNRPPDPDPPATVAALDTSKILKRTTTARDVPARAAADPIGDQGAGPEGDSEAACLGACGPGLSASDRIAIAITRPVIAEWLAAGRRHALAAGLHPCRGCAIKRLAALGGRAFDDCEEAEFSNENKAQAEGAGRTPRNPA